MRWTERTIARALAQQFFNRKHLVVVPNCNWTGHEADILAVTENLRLIDVEIKISRADLKADAKKDKWWQRAGYGWEHRGLPPAARVHPPKVWKHYYLMPFEIWTPELEGSLPSASSGILFIDDWGMGKGPKIVVHRHAKPARDAYRLTPEQATNVARLASLRMWDAYQQVESLRAELIQKREAA